MLWNNEKEFSSQIPFCQVSNRRDCNISAIYRKQTAKYAFKCLAFALNLGFVFSICRTFLIEIGADKPIKGKFFKIE